MGERQVSRRCVHGCSGNVKTLFFLFLLHFLLSSKSLMSISNSDLKVFNYQSDFFFFFSSSLVFTGPAQALRPEATQEQTPKGTPGLASATAFARRRWAET